jgi:O-antigen/teichoic acid export membrane protein
MTDEADSRMTATALRFVTARFSGFRSDLTRRPFLKNVSVMLTGAAAGQFVSVLASPLLTRLYSPQQFGILSVYSAILSILVVISSLRYELSLPLAASAEEALNLAAVCGAILAATTVLVGIAAFCIPEASIEHLWPTPIYIQRVDAYRVLLIVGFLLLGGYYIALYLATWQGAFTAIANTRMRQGIVGPTTQIGLGVFDAGAPGLVIGSILGQSASTLGLFRRAISPHRAHLRAVTWRRATALAWRYRRFPLIASWAALLDAAGGYSLLYLVVCLQYSARVAGFIFLSERIVARPLSVLGTSILQVFVGEAGKTRSSDPMKLRSRFYQVTSRQFALATAWIIVANAGGTVLFPIVFGAEWSDGVVYLRAVSLGYLAQAAVLPVFHTLQLLEKQTMAAAWQLGRLLLIVATIGFAVHEHFSAPWTIFCYSAAQVVCCAVLFGLMAWSIERLQRC